MIINRLKKGVRRGAYLAPMTLYTNRQWSQFSQFINMRFGATKIFTDNIPTGEAIHGKKIV
jgi:hypothetical protein